MPQVTLSDRFDVRTAVGVAVTVGRQVYDAKVNAERAVRFLGGFIGKQALQVDVPLAFCPLTSCPP